MRFEIEIWFGDIDMFGHVNNVAYARFLETARFKFFKDRKIDAKFVLKRIEMDFISPMFIGENAIVEMVVGNIGNTSWEFLYRITEKNSGREVLRAKSIQVWIEDGKKAKIPDEIRSILEKEVRHI